MNLAVKSVVAAVGAAAAIGTAATVPTVVTAAPIGSVLDQAGRHEVSSRFLGTWNGHGRSVTFRANHSAHVSLSSGAMNNEQWAARWNPAGGRVSLTLTRKTSSRGTLGAGLEPGTRWIGSLKRVSGHTVLEFSSMPGVYWCKPAADRAGICGA